MLNWKVSKLNTTNDDDTNNEINIETDVDNKEWIAGILTSGDGTSFMPYTNAFITDQEKLKPVRMHMTIKKCKGNLLERLKLSRVKFLDDEHGTIDEVDDPESPYYVIVETGKKQKFSIQTTKEPRNRKLQR